MDRLPKIVDWFPPDYFAGDFEYDSQDWRAMRDLIVMGRIADVIRNLEILYLGRSCVKEKNQCVRVEMHFGIF